jgi:hypothetical protein
VLAEFSEFFHVLRQDRLATTNRQLGRPALPVFQFQTGNTGLPVLWNPKDRLESQGNPPYYHGVSKEHFLGSPKMLLENFAL